MKDPLLLIDVSYMAYRAFHAMGALAHGGEGVAVAFGVLRDVVGLQNQFQTGRCVFAFDHPAPKHRAAILPTYKASRRARYLEESAEEKEARADFRRQLAALYKTHLPAAGFANVFAAAGYEADDIIAKVVQRLPPGEEAIIVSSDADLWQLLRPGVVVWNPQKAKLLTATGFALKWGIEPDRWADVKAIAGCSGDDVPGVPGVGEATAAKYLRGELGAHTKAHAAIEDRFAMWQENLKLVRLPYYGTPDFEIRPDGVTEETWCGVADALGAKSLRVAVPRTATKKSKGRKRNGKGFGF